MQSTNLNMKWANQHSHKFFERVVEILLIQVFNRFNPVDLMYRYNSKSKSANVDFKKRSIKGLKDTTSMSAVDTKSGDLIPVSEYFSARSF